MTTTRITFRSTPNFDQETGRPDPTYRDVSLLVNGQTYMGGYTSRPVQEFAYSIARSASTRTQKFPAELQAFGADPAKVLTTLGNLLDGCEYPVWER